MASIKTLQAFTISVDGELESFAYNTVYDVDADMASELIDEGLAESYGGGGDGNFATATVTLVPVGFTMGGAWLSIVMPWDDVEDGGIGGTMGGTVTSETYQLVIPMYKSGSVQSTTGIISGIEIYDDQMETVTPTITTSGGVTLVDSDYVVTGDCTLTLTVSGDDSDGK